MTVRRMSAQPQHFPSSFRLDRGQHMLKNKTKRVVRKTPKAEVVSSNLAGRASSINYLARKNDPALTSAVRRMSA